MREAVLSNASALVSRSRVSFFKSWMLASSCFVVCCSHSISRRRSSFMKFTRHVYHLGVPVDLETAHHAHRLVWCRRTFEEVRARDSQSLMESLVEHAHPLRLPSSLCCCFCCCSCIPCCFHGSLQCPRILPLPPLLFRLFQPHDHDQEQQQQQE